MRTSVKIGIVLLVVVALLLAAGAFFLLRDVFFNKTEQIDKSGWSVRAGAICYLDANGKPLLGWQEIEGNRYYFVPDAGIRATNWMQIGTKRYYFDENGIMQTGWQTIKGKQYYFAEEGYAVTGWQIVDGVQYCFGEDGVALEGWFEDENGKYYLDEKGRPTAGMHQINDKLYCFDTDGRPVVGWMERDGEKYYCKEDGEIAVGRVEIDGVDHFFTSKGKYIILVNHDIPVPEGYKAELVTTGAYQIDRNAKEPLEAMLKDCKQAGFSCGINNIYRSKDMQTAVWTRTVNGYLSRGMSYEEACAEAAKDTMEPGHSEHQLGLAADLDGSKAAYKWLEDNCWEYGFILRYPADCIEHTGVIHEPWHLRYVGTELALELKELGMCLEEYVQMLSK